MLDQYPYPAQFAVLRNAPVANFGESGDTSTQILNRFVANAQFANPVLIWSGRNNYANASQVESDIATMVADLTGSPPYRVLSIINDNSSNEISGGAGYNEIIALNSALSSTYGANYVDVRAALVAAYNPANAVDVANHSVDIPPTSLMAEIGTASLGSSIGSSDTSITLSSLDFPLNGALTLISNVATIDNEQVEITAVTGDVATVTRAMGGTTAASHSAGAAITITNLLHPNSAGYAVVAKTVQASFSF